VSDATD
jgi:hypothetical protein